MFVHMFNVYANVLGAQCSCVICIVLCCGVLNREEEREAVFIGVLSCKAFHLSALNRS